MFIHRNVPHAPEQLALVYDAVSGDEDNFVLRQREAVREEPLRFQPLARCYQVSRRLNDGDLRTTNLENSPMRLRAMFSLGRRIERSGRGHEALCGRSSNPRNAARRNVGDLGQGVENLI